MNTLNNFDRNKSIINNTKKFSIDEKKTTLRDSLLPENTGVIAGNLTAQTTGQYQLTAHLTFNESKTPIIVNLITQVTQIIVHGENIKSLPTKIVWNTPYPLVYQFSNPSENKLDATQIKLTIQALDTPKLIRKNLEGTEKEVLLSELNGTGTLDAGEVLMLSGEFTAKTLGKTRGPQVIFQYAEGADITFPDTSEESMIEVMEINVIAKVSKDLPETTNLGESQEVQFTFTNPNTEIPASELELIITEE